MKPSVVTESGGNSKSAAFVTCTHHNHVLCSHSPSFSLSTFWMTNTVQTTAACSYAWSDFLLHRPLAVIFAVCSTLCPRHWWHEETHVSTSSWRRCGVSGPLQMLQMTNLFVSLSVRLSTTLPSFLGATGSGSAETTQLPGSAVYRWTKHRPMRHSIWLWNLLEQCATTRWRHTQRVSAQLLQVGRNM